MVAVLITLVVALLAYVIGRATLPLFVGRCADPPRCIVQLALLLGNTLLSIIGLLLAASGLFTLARVIWIALLVCAVGVGVRRWRPQRFSRLPYSAADAAGAVFVAVAYLWAFPAFDTSLFGSDSSVYLASGVHIAEQGSIVVHDPTIALLQPAQRLQWFPGYYAGSITPPFFRVGGGLLLPDLYADRVLPAFQPLLSVWVAIFSALGGDQAIAAPITYFGALFLWAFASFIAAFAGRWAAGFALVLLTSLVPQYWYSRFLMPEIPSQYFLWAGLWVGALSLSSGAQRLGALAGLAIGVAGLMRLDVLVHVAAGLALWMGLAPRRFWPAGRGFAPALAVVAAYAIAHQVLFPTHYLAEIFPRLLAAVIHEYLVLDYRVAIAAAVLAVVLAAALRSNLLDGGTWLRAGLRVVALGGFVTYAVAIFGTSQPNFPTNLEWIRIYAGWPMVVAGAIGLPFWIRRARNPAERFALLFGLLAIVQLFYYPPVSPQPLWAIRRFLRIAFPTLAITAALALNGLAERGQRLLALLGLAAVLGFGPRLAFTYRQPAYQHSMRYVRSIGALIPRGSVIVGDPYFFIDSQMHIALWLTRDTPAFLVSRTTTDLLHELRVAMGTRLMFWIGPVGRVPPPSSNLTLAPVAAYTFSVATRRFEPYDYRDDLGLREISLAVYRVDLKPVPTSGG